MVWPWAHRSPPLTGPSTLPGTFEEPLDLLARLPSLRNGESFTRVHWVAVPKVLRARRVNRRRRQGGEDVGSAGHRR
eukprot:SAG25_NODE_2563_length_1530_cov_66.713935_2_plen_77_part_00